MRWWKNHVICYFFTSQVLFINLYFSRKVQKFLLGLCPDGKMSAIGKYPRNAIGYTPNIGISLRFNTLTVLFRSRSFVMFPQRRFNLFSTLDVVMLVFFNQFSSLLSPSTIFYINNVMRSRLKLKVRRSKWSLVRFIWVELFYIIFSIAVSLKDLPTSPELPHRVHCTAFEKLYFTLKLFKTF